MSNMPGEYRALNLGRVSLKRQVNFTEFGLSSVSESSEVKSVIRIGSIASKSVSARLESVPQGIRTTGEVSICSTCKHSSEVRGADCTSYSFAVVTL